MKATRDVDMVRMITAGSLAAQGRRVAAIVCMVGFSTPLLAGEAPQIQRDGSILSFDWKSDAPGSWQLQDEQGQVCEGGQVGAGQNSVILRKVPAQMSLQVVITDGGETRSYRAQGAPKISGLTKPKRASVIYQLPVRTYLARGMGAELTGKLTDLTTERLRDIKNLGADYIWLTGVLEHASLLNSNSRIVKGEAGSYYAIHDSWDVAPEIGTLNDLSQALDRAHAVGLRILIDFIGNHTARLHHTDVSCKQRLDFGRGDAKDQFFYQDNNYYYIQNTTFQPPVQPGIGGQGVPLEPESPAKVTGDDIRVPNPQIDAWYDTVKLNYGYDIADRRSHYNPRPRTWNQMVDMARYWLELGVDGFRMDFAHAVPMEFWRYFVAEIKKTQPEVFLLAEAYEKDERMKLPGFSYGALLRSGFDSVYNSEVYWGLRQQAIQSGSVRAANPMYTPALASAIVEQGFMFTQYMENHDEVRLGSRSFAPFVADRSARANLGLAYSTYVALLPGHFLMQGGQELQEDASINGRLRSGSGRDNGKTSIFDFTYQAQVKQWLYDSQPDWMKNFRQRYQKLLALKSRAPFATAHSKSQPTYLDLDAANYKKEQSQWIASYVRYAEGKVYLVVMNSDPFSPHATTIHMTTEDYKDTIGALEALGIRNDATRYAVREVFDHPGWMPSDPAISGEGLPGWVFYRAGNIPSGLYLGEIPAATTFVFEVAVL